ncbi:MAG: terminase small subunit [Desulfobacterales bacterium]|nr:terminase small subunit [Desulfobacterales bacterium]
MKKLTKRQISERLRWDRFAEELVVDFKMGPAYLRAGYKCKPSSARVSAYRLMLTNVYVQKKVSELIESRREATAYNREKAESEYEEFRKLALKKEDVKGGVAAVTGKAKLFGLLTDVVEGRGTFAKALHEAMKDD